MDPRIEMIGKNIRDVPDFPKPGIIFKDITPLLSSVEAFKAITELFAEHYRPLELQGILAIESRGFIFGAPLALALGIPLHILRKPGKLPAATDSVSYSLEYGTATLELHKDSLLPGSRVVIMDDLLATGGTAAAAIQLARKQQAMVVECGFVIELSFLEGNKALAETPSFSLLKY